MAGFIYFTEEQKRRANEVNLESFLLRQGERLLKSGREKRLASDHSITVRGNQWYDHAIEKGGGAIDFVKMFYGKDFPDAVTMLLDGEQGEVCYSDICEKGKSREEGKPFALPEKNTEMRRALVDYLHIQSSDRVITTLPMCHTYGLSLVQTHLCKGASIVVYNDSVLNHSFRKEIEKNQVTTFGGVPFTYEMLYKASFFKHLPESIKYMTQAGAKLSKELNTFIVRVCKEQHKKFIVMYGQTEATARISYVPWKDAERKIGSIGVPIPNGYMELHDEMDKIILESYTQGEIIYKGANIMLGYAEKQSDLKKGESMDGILHTGDLAYKDEDGFYFITGRKSRYIKLYGVRTNLNDIEKQMEGHNITAFCTGSDNHINIYLVEKVNKEQVINILKNSFNMRTRDFSIFYISNVPRTESGKIDYTKLETYIV